MKAKDVETLVRQAFGSHTADKGKAYWRQGRVQLLGSSNENEGTLVGARVRGRQRYPYNVILSYDPEFPTRMRGSCTCPMSFSCKHVAATAFAHFSTQTEATPDSQLDAWLSRLRRSQGGTQEVNDNPDQLLYLLHFTTHRQIQVTPVKVRLLKKGGYGQERKVQIYQLKESHSGFAPVDAEIGSLLSGLATSQYAYYNQSSDVTLKGELGAVALRQILLSGRCHLEDKDGARLLPGSIRTLNLNWEKGRNGWRLHPGADPPFDQWFMLSGPWYYDSIQQSVGLLETPLEPALLLELLKAPPVPANRLEEITLELLKALPEVVLPVPSGVKIKVSEIKDVLPEPQLTLRGLRSESNEPVYAAELEFVYDGVYFSPVQTAERVRVEQDEQLFHLHRKLEQENLYRRQLDRSGLKLQTDDKTYLLPGQTARECAEAWEEWLATAAPGLEDTGWTVHVSSDFGLGIYTGEQEWQAEVKTGDQDNWFDLSLGIELDGNRINLLPILVGALQQWAEPADLMALLERQDSLLLPMGSEQWLRVPSDRLRGIVSVLIELYDREALTPDGDLTLSWYQALGLDGLLGVEGLNWQGAERIRELTEKLKGFEGIAVVPPPDNFAAQLRPYQQEGYNWLQFLREFGFHGILADDMGLGKTIQTLAHLLKEKQAGRADGPSLVIAPTSVVGNWYREAARFAPDLKVLVLHGIERKEDFADFASYDLLITTYTLLRLDLEHYLEQNFYLLILDEAQYIKNPQAKTALAIFQLKARHRLALSGTPMENHLAELWSIYHFLMPGFLRSLNQFTRLFRTPIEKQGNVTRSEALRQRVKPFLLRRTKLQVERDLPAKTEIIQYVSLNGAQRDLYETIRVAMDTRVKEEIGKKGLKRSQIMLLDALLKLRQVCCDPQLLKLEAAKKVRDSAKREWLLETLPEMVEEGRRILIFSQFVSMINLIEADLKAHKIASVRLTGATTKRDAVVDSFQQGKVPVFLISLKAGGVGLNLTAADTVIHYDPWWNPAAENQATDRAWRIGQDKPVFVYKLITEQTIEEKILALQAKKRLLTEGIYSEQEDGAFKIEAEELLALLEK